MTRMLITCKQPIKSSNNFKSTGGEEVLLEYAGKDCSEPFDDVGHSQDAKDILKKYHVGTIVESERAANKKKQKEEKKK